MNIIWRVAGLALAAGLILFLVSLIVKVLLVALGVAVVVRVVGPRLMGSRAFGRFERTGWQSSQIISIDNPTYRSPMSSQSFERIIPIN
ncbi:hypothetical protein [Spirosoma radiotolerans]|uniref:Uncharacterized protein n=1 Tax=Spirosoma radiotolerans TaxID=1379870 RepID=A0A0E3ZUG4_9BACT|nr:hypothetical protein [Spirosoma radiotolerans]AKD55530.1 hypothetical protein SD10_12075 [Spirosoma radiotolerans]